MILAVSKKHSPQPIYSKECSSRLAEELDDGSHLRSGERLGSLLVALGYHRWPHASGEVHLLAKMAQGSVLVVVGVIQLCQVPEVVGFYRKFIHSFVHR